MSSKYFFLALAVAVPAAAPASAYFINYGQDGLPGGNGVNADTPLFYDNYDSQPAANVSHAGFADNATVGKPLDANVLFGGYYTYSGASNNRTVQVTDHAGANVAPYAAYVDPGPYVPTGTTNTNYLRFYRGGDSQSILQQRCTRQNTSGDTLHWEEMICLEGNSADSNIQIFLQDLSVTPNTHALGFKADLSGDTGVIKPYTGAAFSTAISGLNWTPDVWQKWEVDYTLGTSTYSLTIDGTSVSNIPVNNSASAVDSVSYTMYGSNYNVGPACLDEVPRQIPEPSTLALLACGLLGLLAYAWRKRK